MMPILHQKIFQMDRLSIKTEHPAVFRGRVSLIFIYSVRDLQGSSAGRQQGQPGSPGTPSDLYLQG